MKIKKSTDSTNQAKHQQKYRWKEFSFFSHKLQIFSTTIPCLICAMILQVSVFSVLPSIICHLLFFYEKKLLKVRVFYPHRTYDNSQLIILTNIISYDIQTLEWAERLWCGVFLIRMFLEINLDQNVNTFLKFLFCIKIRNILLKVI